MNLLMQETATMPSAGAEDSPAADIKVYQGIGKAKNKIVVVASDIGNSSVVTNKVEEIATDVCRRQNIAPDKLIFIEHRRARPNFEETFDLVHLDWKEGEKKFVKPSWSNFTREATEAITGEKTT